MVGKILYNIGNRYLQDNIHTAFKVQTKTNLSFEALLIAVDSQILNRIFVILLSNRILQFCRFAVIILCGNRERQIEKAHKRQQDGCCDYDSFVLHFVSYFIVFCKFLIDNKQL